MLIPRRAEIQKKASKSVCVSQFAPCQPKHRKLTTDDLERLLCDLIAPEQPCAFPDVQVPSAQKITHDYTYTKLSSNEMPDVTTELADVRVEPGKVMNVTVQSDANVDTMDSCHSTGQQQEADKVLTCGLF